MSVTSGTLNGLVSGLAVLLGVFSMGYLLTLSTGENPLILDVLIQLHYCEVDHSGRSLKQFSYVFEREWRSCRRLANRYLKSKGTPMRKYVLASFIVVAALSLLAISGVAGNPNGGRPLTATLTGDAEAPGPGDPDGSGSARITLNSGLGQVSFVIEVVDIGPALAAHIHSGAADVAGPVVVNFDVAANGLSGTVDADRDLIKDIRKNPSDY